MATITIVWDRMPGYVQLNVFDEKGVQTALEFYGGDPSPSDAVKHLVEKGVIKPEDDVQHKEGEDPHKVGPSFAHSK